jgi:5-formyltetrahydrofolate cyclo-ligase
VNSDAKAALRKEIRRQRKIALDLAPNSSWKHILGANEFKGVSNVASYISYGEEPETADLNKELTSQGITVIIPQLLDDKDLAWTFLDGTPFQDLEKVGVVIVPALRVDRDGNRLGQGGGSYDRALPRFNAWKIALVHHNELTSEAVPHEDHDATMNAAATPDLLVRFH